MKFIKKITSWQVVLFVQLAVSVFLAGITFKLNVLPAKYEAVMVAALALLLIAMFFLTREGKRGKHAKVSIRPIIGKVVSLMLSIVMFIGSGMLAKTDGAIEAITSINAIVCKNSVPVFTNIICTKYVIKEARPKTNVTAAPIPAAVSTFLETPKNGHIPKNCDVITLLTRTILSNKRI